MEFAIALSCVYAIVNNEYESRDLPKEVTVYYLEEQYAEYIGELPLSYPGSYQIPLAGLESPTFSAGGGVQVDSSGIISPKGTTYYYKDGWGYTYPVEGYQYTRTKYYEANTTVRVTSNGVSQDIRVYSKSYAKIYANNKVDRVISEVVKDEMTGYEKLYAVTEWIANHTNYSGSYWDALDMLIFDRGDCWASTYTIIEFCKKLGFYCKERRANLDPNTGSGHRNVAAVIDGVHYIADAGFSGRMPRKFFVREEPGAFSSGLSSKGYYLIYQYDGEEEEVAIPCEHKNATITGLGLSGYSVFIYGTVKKLIIPNCISIIGEGAFSLCPNLTDVEIDDDNINFERDNGMVYKKGKDTLIFTPTNKKSISFDPVTTVIGNSALGSLTLDKLVIPSTVKTLSSSALAFSNIKNLTIENGVEFIGNRAFEKMTSSSKVVIPDSAKVIGNYSFNSSSIDNVVFPQGITEIPIGCFYQSHITKVFIPDTVTTIRKQAFFYCRWLTNISLPASITSIEKDAFGSPVSVRRHIYFAGSEKRWKKIKFENDLPSDTIMHYGDYPDDDSSSNGKLNSAHFVSSGYLVWIAIAVAMICQMI